MRITSQSMLRSEFWRDHPHFTKKYKAYSFDPTGRGQHPVLVPWEQNEYPIEVRMAWVDYVDYQQRAGNISENLAQVAVL